MPVPLSFVRETTEAEKARLAKEANPNPNSVYVPPPGATDNPTAPEYIHAKVKEWEPVLAELTGVAAFGALAWMLFQEAMGKRTLIGRLTESPTGTEMVRGAWQFLGNLASAGVANPVLGFAASWVGIQLLQKAKIVTEKAGAWATAGIFGLEGVKVTADAVGSLEGIFGGGKSHEGPTTYANTYAPTISYALPKWQEIPPLETPAQLPMNPAVLKAIQAMTKKEQKALMQ